MALLTATLGLAGVGVFEGVAQAAVPYDNVFPIIDRDNSVCHDDFGAARPGGRTHKGNDCMAPAGTPLLAVESGTVEAGVDPSGLGGIYVLLQGDSGTGYYYAHNSRNLVATGNRVAKGQHIADVGNTGDAAGGPTHVHFEIRPDGIHAEARVDPQKYLPFWTTVTSSPPKTHLLWLQRDSLDGGTATRSFVYGLAGDLPLVGDWDGNGSETPGVYRPAEATFYLKNANSGGDADWKFRYGTPGIGQWPVVGDWDGNGTDTIGVFNLNTAQWLLRNSNTGGDANLDFIYGTKGDLPVVGDWNGNGTTTVGVRRGNTWLLKNGNSGGDAEISFTYGRAGDFPLVGDWNGNRTEGIGVVQANTWLLRYSLSPGDPQITFAYGRTGDVFVTGDWNHNGVPDVGVVRVI